MPTLSRTKVRIIVSLFSAVIIIGILWFRACRSAKEHYLRAAAMPRMSTEQITELKRAALFRMPLNVYAAAAFTELKKHLDNPEAREAFCDAIYGSRHPFWNDEQALNNCAPVELPSIKLRDESPLSFKGNALSFITFACWLAAMFGLIFRGFSETGALTNSARRWGLITTAAFISWCASLIISI